MPIHPADVAIPVEIQHAVHGEEQLVLVRKRRGGGDIAENEVNEKEGGELADQLKKNAAMEKAFSEQFVGPLMAVYGRKVI
jgi:hypothetical protein